MVAVQATDVTQAISFCLRSAALQGPEGRIRSAQYYMLSSSSAVPSPVPRSMAQRNVSTSLRSCIQKSTRNHEYLQSKSPFHRDGDCIVLRASDIPGLRYIYGAESTRRPLSPGYLCRLYPSAPPREKRL